VSRKGRRQLVWLVLAVIGGVLLVAHWRKHKAKAPAQAQVPATPTIAPPSPKPARDKALPPVEQDSAALRRAMRNAAREARLAWAVPPTDAWHDDERGDLGDDWGQADNDDDDHDAAAWLDEDRARRSTVPVPWDPSTWAPLAPSKPYESPTLKADVLKPVLDVLGLPPADAATIAERLAFVVEKLSPAQLAFIEARLQAASPDDLHRVRRLVAQLATMSGNEPIFAAAHMLLNTVLTIVNRQGGAR
jgi:hypothetical protein